MLVAAKTVLGKSEFIDFIIADFQKLKNLAAFSSLPVETPRYYYQITELFKNGVTYKIYKRESLGALILPILDLEDDFLKDFHFLGKVLTNESLYTIVRPDFIPENTLTALYNLKTKTTQCYGEFNF